LAEKKENEKK
jgi:hypothetical protein